MSRRGAALLTGTWRTLLSKRADGGLYLDRFTGSADPLTTGSGRTVTGSRWKLLDGYLRGGTQVASVAWGNSEVVYTGFARVAGRTLAIDFISQDRETSFALGWASSASFADPRTQGHGWVNNAGSLGVITPGVTTVIDQSTYATRTTQYVAYIVLGSRGAALLLSTIGTQIGIGMTDQVGIPQYPLARVVWWEDADTTATLYPYYSALGDLDAYPNGHASNELAIYDEPTWAQDGAMAHFIDRFDRANSTTSVGGAWTAVRGTWGISTNRAYVPTPSGFSLVRNNTPTLSDGMFQFDFTMPASGTRFGGLAFRFTATHFLCVGTFTGVGDQIGINQYSLATGSYANGVVTFGAFTFAYGTTYRITLWAYGNKYLVAVDGVVFDAANWATDASSYNTTGTGVGFMTTDGEASTHFWDNLVIMPHTVTLPAILPAPRIFTVGATLASDTFTDTNGTRLNAHTPTLGGAWTEHAGTWTIQSNTVSVAGANLTPFFATQNVAADVEASVTVTPPAFADGTAIIRQGIAVRYIDANNYVMARLLMGPAQPFSDEIELISASSATTGGIRRKMNIQNYIQGSTPVVLKIQVRGDLLHCFLDDKPILSYVIPADLLTGTRVGFYHDRDVDDANCTFDGWTVKALT